MAYNIIFNESKDSIHVDFKHLMVYINDYCCGLGLDPNFQNVDTSALYNVLEQMRIDFPCTNGIDNASPFKKAAQFVCHFIAHNPVKKPFTKDMVGKDLAGIRNNQNSMIALDLAIESLYGATLDNGSGKGPNKLLKNKIVLSTHSYVDIVQALSAVSSVTHFQLIALLFEQMAYKVNPTCQYTLME